jgi:transposase
MSLSQKEQQKYLIIKEYINGKLTRKQAANRLSVSLKTISVLKTRYLKFGKDCFSHKLKSAAPRNHIRLDVENAIVNCYKENFSSFNFTHFYEYATDSGLLYELAYGECITARTVARVLERNGIISPQANRKRRKNNQHPTRPRRLSFGELSPLAK